MLFRLFVVLFLAGLPFLDAAPSYAASGDAYRQALAFAVQGRDAEAVAMLGGAAETAPEIWGERMHGAAGLLTMRMQQSPDIPPLDGMHAALLAAYTQSHLAPPPADSRVTGILAAVFPGAGHAWLGRWHDAAIAALLVWPMLLLTLWAFRRSMGPLTLFFALITLWLWSGSVFSAVSLCERSAFEAYAMWWQGLWQASGLPGRPW